MSQPADRTSRLSVAITAAVPARLNTTSVILALQWLELNKAALLAEWQAADSGV